MVKIKLLKVEEFYEYIFYKITSWYAWLGRGDPTAYQCGWYVLSFLNWTQFLTVLILLETITGVGFKQLGAYLHDSKLLIILIGTSFLIPNYFLLVRNRKYKKIIKKFENENRKERLLGNIYTWLYILASFFFPIFFTYFFHGKIQHSFLQ